MDDVLIKFDGKNVQATGVGSKNPVAAMIAQMMLSEMNGLSVAKTNDVQAQSVGNAAAVGSSGIGF